MLTICACDHEGSCTVSQRGCFCIIPCYKALPGTQTFASSVKSHLTTLLGTSTANALLVIPFEPCPCVMLAGFAMGGLTALAGPIIEIILIRQLGLYHYTHADAIGVPSWIPWVYFCGAPAVGNLGRKVRMILLQQHAVL